MNNQPLSHEQYDQPKASGLEVVESGDPSFIDLSEKSEIGLYLNEKGESGDKDEGFRLINLQDYPRDEKGNILYSGQRLNKNVSFLLVQGEGDPDWKSGKGFKGLRPGEVVTLGRSENNPLKDRFNLSSKTISREHMLLAVPEEGGGIFIENLNSTNGVSYSSELVSSDSVESEGGIDELSDTEELYLKMFPVVEKPQDLPESNLNPYDLMFMDDGPEKQALRQALHDEELENGPLIEAHKNYEALVNAETSEYSKAIIEMSLQANPQLKDILAENGLDGDYGAMVDAIRTTPKVRAGVAEYFSNKLDRAVMEAPGTFGERVVNNSHGNLKSDHMTGRKRMSRDYVTKLVLDMLGGSFSEKREGNDPIEYDNEGRPKIGQHRSAARDILFIP
jgi:pSer/pThr/pTyr-binding forkhead associated (FHA) protein